MVGESYCFDGFWMWLGDGSNAAVSILAFVVVRIIFMVDIATVLAVVFVVMKLVYLVLVVSLVGLGSVLFQV